MRNLDNLVVGLDGSRGSEIALNWAIAQDPEYLTLVHGFSPGHELLAASVQINLDPVRAEHQRLLESSWSQPVRDAGIEFETVLVAESAAHALTTIAARTTADAVIIGHQGHGRWSSHVVGDTAGRLLHRCDIPLILTDECSVPERLTGTIVVGLRRPDDAHSRELLWALDAAECYGTDLHVVSLVESPAYLGAGSAFDLNRMQTEVRREIDQLVSSLAATHQAIGISGQVGFGSIADELASIAEATSASMVVIGSNHPGRFSGSIRGSVARHLPSLLNCPMAAVPRQ